MSPAAAPARADTEAPVPVVPRIAVLDTIRGVALASILAPLRRTGRMSLSVYIGGSLPAAFVFGGWGRGLFGRVGPLGCLLLPPVLFGVSIALSTLWLRHFRLRPGEWLLRSWTFGCWEPLYRADP